MKRFAAAATLSILLSACATKGFVRKTVGQQVGALQAQTQSDIAAERTARMAGDSVLNADVHALRGALDSLRTEFGVKITALESGMQFAVPVHFAFNDASVRDTDRAALDRFADVVKRFYGQSLVTVEGFADPAGSAAYNKRLSENRATAVRDYLTGKGLANDGIRTVGYGESRQVRPGASGDRPGAELNRRVVFVIESSEGGPSNVTTTAPPTAP